MTAPAGIVTPEAVVLDFETAGLGSRLIAEAIDLSVQFAAGLLVTVAAAAVGSTPARVVDYVGLFLVIFGYPTAMETMWRGRTLGKAALGLRVVTVEGAPIRFRHAAIRAALSLVDIFLLSGIPGILAILFTPRNQRLGDLVAGTIVLRERSAVGMPVATRFSVPPALESYAGTLDVAALTGPEYATVRSFLLRAGELAPGHRASLAAQIAGPLAAHLGHAPPPTLSPEWYLVCVAAAVQRRAGPPVGAPAGWQPAGGPGVAGAPPWGAAGALAGSVPGRRRSAWDPAEIATASAPVGRAGASAGSPAGPPVGPVGAAVGGPADAPSGEFAPPG